MMIIHIFPYLILLITVSYFGLNSNRYNSNISNILFIISSVIIVVGSFRRLFFYNKYDDFTQYYYHFSNLNNFSDLIQFQYNDPSFYLALYLLRKFEIDSPEVLYASLCGILCLILYLVFNKLKKIDKEIFLFLTILSPFFIIYSGQFVRQATSLCLLMLAITFPDIKKRFLVIIFSCTIHFSVLLALPVIFIEILKINRALKIFLFIMLIGLIFPINNNFLNLLQSNIFLYNKFVYWLNDELEPAGLVFKWIPLFLITAFSTKLISYTFGFNAKVFKDEVTGFEARAIWLFLYFTAIGFYGRYLNAFSLRFGLWAIIFSGIPIFIFKSRLSKKLYVILYVTLCVIVALNLMFNKSPEDFDFIYQRFFLPTLSLQQYQDD